MKKYESGCLSMIDQNFWLTLNKKGLQNHIAEDEYYKTSNPNLIMTDGEQTEVGQAVVWCLETMTSMATFFMKDKHQDQDKGGPNEGEEAGGVGGERAQGGAPAPACLLEEGLAACISS